MKKKIGIVKWFRFDGCGYIIDKEDTSKTYMVDVSVLAKNKFLDGKRTLVKGQKVLFRPKQICGGNYAMEVEPLSE